MGLIRKMTSVSTLGVVDFKSDKERIANSTRKGMKIQRQMLAEMRNANAAQGIARAPELSRINTVAEYQVKSRGKTGPASTTQPGSRAQDVMVSRLIAKAEKGETAAIASLENLGIEWPPPVYQIGDVVNGHTLTNSNTWVPVEGSGVAAIEAAPVETVPVEVHLEKLAELHAKGLIDDDEFKAAKAKALGI